MRTDFYWLHAFAFLFFVACSPGKSSLEDAINSYHRKISTHAGTGTFSNVKIEILEKVTRNDTIFALASSSSTYTPPPTGEEQPSRDEQSQLWYIIFKEAENWEVIGIMDPKKIAP